MNLKINCTLDKKRGQSIVEYILIFIVITVVGIMVFFSGFEPASNERGKRDNFFTKLKIKGAFDAAVNSAIRELNKQ